MGETNTVHFVRVYLSYTKNAFIPLPHSYWARMGVASKKNGTRKSFHNAFDHHLRLTLCGNG